MTYTKKTFEIESELADQLKLFAAHSKKKQRDVINELLRDFFKKNRVIYAGNVVLHGKRRS